MIVERFEILRARKIDSELVLVTVGLPGPTWLAVALAAAAVIELAALVLTAGDRHA